MKNFFLIALLLIGSIAFAQENNESALTIDQIMQGESFVGVSPSNIFWSDDSQSIYFNWNPDLEPINSIYKYDIKSKRIHKATIEEEQNLTKSGDYDYASDKSEKVYIKNGDVYLYELSSNNSKRLITTFNDKESNVSFSTDDSSIIFERTNNLYRFNLSENSIEQLTNFQSGKGKSETKENEQENWLEEQQLELFEVLRDRKVRKDLTNDHTKELKIDQASKIYLDGKYISNFTLSGNSDFVTYKLSHYPSNKRTMVPHFVAESGYTKEQTAYSKVGGIQATHELWILDVKLDTVVQLAYENFTGAYKKPLYLQEYSDSILNSKHDKPKPVNFFNPKTSSDGKLTVVEIRSMDNKDRWFAQIDFENRKLIELNHQHDEAWIAGPGIPWQQAGGNWGWVSDNESIYFHSEKTGYSHLYQINVTTKKEKTLTKGEWEVYDAKLSNDGLSMFLTTNEVHPGERQLYRLNLKNLKREKLTSQIGNNEIVISPNEENFAIRYSYSNKPWELYLLANTKGSKEIEVTNSTTSDFEAYDWKIPEIISFKASDGVNVNARLYVPETGAEGKPMVVFVHGAGYLQNAHKWWSGYFREYMFHNILVDNGFVVLDIDYRASKGYGRDFRTGIYRHMGGKDLSDQIDGVQHLVKEYGVDANNVGIYGGSYGGFITLMGMFNSPETFKSGAGIRSVTDWAHYHHSYTANILNTPATDSIAYQRSSPINFAEGLEGNLLILHGMVDDNVHFQDVVRLNQRLIELKKENWEMALYPVERHGFIEPSSWADEYKRIYKLFSETLK